MAKGDIDDVVRARLLEFFYLDFLVTLSPNSPALRFTSLLFCKVHIGVLASV